MGCGYFRVTGGFLVKQLVKNLILFIYKSMGTIRLARFILLRKNITGERNQPLHRDLVGQVQVEQTHV